MIVSSTYKVGIPQQDGRCYVVEMHTSDTGDTYRVEYGPVDVDMVDCQQIMQDRAVALNEQLAFVAPFERGE